MALKGIFRTAFVCVFIAVCLLTGCAAIFAETADKTPKVELSDEQKSAIELFVEHREEWKETKEGIVTYEVNRIHIYESETLVMLTVAHVEELDDDWFGTWGVKGYVVMDGEFHSAGTYCYSEWLPNCFAVDMGNMTDEELYDVLEEAYISFLSKS